MAAVIAPQQASAAANSIQPIQLELRSPSYPPPLLPLSPATLDENASMPAPIPPRQSLFSCGASVRYTPRRRNALVPLPLLPPVPPHVVVQRIAGVVKILAAPAPSMATAEPKDVEMSPVAPALKVQFPIDGPTAEPAPAPVPEPAPGPPLRPRVRKDSRTITPRFSVPIPSSSPSTPAAPQSAPAPASRAIPRAPFPVRPLDFNNLPANRKPTFDPIVFNPVEWSRPRVPSPLNPGSPTSPIDSTSTIPPHIAALLSTSSSLPARVRLHPGYLLRARPRPAHAILTPSGGWTLRATLARGGKNDELRRCALMSSESGRKLAWMGGDVRGAVEVWEAEQALEGMEDEEMEFDDDMDITQIYVQPCDENEDEDDTDDVVCTGERKADENMMMNKQNAVVCCPFEFESPTTCTELDVEMECDEMEVEMESQKLTTQAQGRTWSNVFEVEDSDDDC